MNRTINNPYLDEYNALMAQGDYIGRGTELCRKYSWAIPDEAALMAIRNFGDDRIVEVGAGNGYWAHLLEQMNVEITAYDVEPYDNHWMDGTKWGRVIQRDGLESVLSEQEQQYHWRPFTLMMVWPYMNEMAYDSLMAYEGQRLIYVGEGQGGCTASDDFFDALDDMWDLVKTVFIPQWGGMHDYLELYERKA